MTRHRSVDPPGLAAPAGPYAWVTSAPPGGRLVFCAGAISIDESGQVVGVDDIITQTHQVMRNLRVALESAGASFADVVKINNYVTDADLYTQIAPVRQEYLSEPYPASTMVEVKRLLYPELLFEVEALAIVYDDE